MVFRCLEYVADSGSVLLAAADMMVEGRKSEAYAQKMHDGNVGLALNSLVRLSHPSYGCQVKV